MVPTTTTTNKKIKMKQDIMTFESNNKEQLN